MGLVDLILNLRYTSCFSTDELSEFAYRTTVLTVTSMIQVSGGDSIATEVLGAPAKVIIKFWYT